MRIYNLITNFVSFLMYLNYLIIYILPTHGASYTFIILKLSSLIKIYEYLIRRINSIAL